ncbi:peptidoglycan-binding protein [Clostridium psychrophilum]|uniref:peptidoglycan-binding protein n=1 Tax=Clostridium psychrophilum TaxID=132926 RepID=UPI001C0B10F4|nr:peptidoglycan-binding protein [Clostridium psychrophilum]MBU3182555.1 peptidoglycan-binding protein [Clostridium psychrophilum]
MANSILKIGSTGETVRYLQHSLAKLGYNPGIIDGIFGPKTTTVVKLFQKSKGLIVDGIVGNKTWTAIDKALDLLDTIKNYFFFKENTKYVYEGIGNKYASYTILVDYLIGNRVQLRSNNDATEVVKVIENRDGKLTVILSRNECHYRDNLTQNPSNDTEVLLKEPLIKGTNWTITGNRKRYISNVNVEVTTPVGKYKTLEVTTENKTEKTLDYYAANIGLVKTIFISNGNLLGAVLLSKVNQVLSLLSKIEKNISLTQSLEFYYPNVDEIALNFIKKQVNFKTNDLTRLKIETAYKILPKGNIFRVLSPNAKIKSLYLNKDGMAYVDFTKEFVTEMNIGAGYEVQVLQCVTNTIGMYYNTNKVYLTVEGNPYASGHILMEKGEFFTVDTSFSSELK